MRIVLLCTALALLITSLATLVFSDSLFLSFAPMLLAIPLAVFAQRSHNTALKLERLQGKGMVRQMRQYSGDIGTLLIAVGFLGAIAFLQFNDPSTTHSRIITTIIFGTGLVLGIVSYAIGFVLWLLHREKANDDEFRGHEGMGSE
jgi:hypothetical protein